jgi:uncharacterized membrane protein
LFSKLSITNHHSLNTRTTDLGFYDNILFQSLHGKPLGCSFVKGEWHGSAHFDPILVLLTPLYALYTHPETLLALQSFWLGAGVIPLYLLCRIKGCGRFVALAVAATYVAYPALHGINMYEFHSLALITPLLLALLYFFETAATRRYWITLIALLLCREDVPLVLVFVGLYQILSGRSHGARLGRRTILLSLIYFAFVKLVVTKSGVLVAGAEGYSYAYYYADLIQDRSGVAQLLISLVTNPTFVVKHLFGEAKLLFLMQLFIPLAALPLLAKRGWIMLLYGLACCLLASRDAVYSIHFQYTSILLPLAFALVPDALARLRNHPGLSSGALANGRVTHGLAAFMLVAAGLSGWKFGAPLENEAFRGGFTRIARRMTPESERRYLWVKNTAKRIPRGASVGVTDKMGPHVSNRMRAYFYTVRASDFVFIDEAELRAGKLERHKKNLQAGELIEIARYGKMVLFQSKRSPWQPLPAIQNTPEAPTTPEAAPPATTGAKLAPPAPAPDRKRPPSPKPTAGAEDDPDGGGDPDRPDF